jgi:DNA modification methylase
MRRQLAQRLVGNYRGNWSPYILSKLILHYTAPDELDQMMGSGTTLVECKLLRRRSVGHVFYNYQPNL